MDGAWRKDSGDGGYRVVIRDNWGSFVGALMGKQRWCSSPAVAESAAIRAAVRLGISFDLGSVVIESDAQAVVNMVNGPISTSQDLGTIIHDINALSKSFQVCSCSFVRRSCNTVAHEVAGRGLMNSENVNPNITLCNRKRPLSLCHTNTETLKEARHVKLGVICNKKRIREEEEWATVSPSLSAKAVRFGNMQKQKQKGIIITEGTTMGLQSDNGDRSKGFGNMHKQKQKGIIITKGTTMGLQSNLIMEMDRKGKCS
ncbi:hypothetical protein RHMOL_Rhmol02G0119500 [Rhododendron molle]|uniref:Uncharacterized protein n=1 Tax=Rhododendron molle TaxID=49168 RepID=A0ACC0PQG6_RHOML|nr:hypothetical protein RHMOL_Rhmol02G0119500 [Rhododendron molle]